MDKAEPVAGLYLYRPTHEYSQAFDLFARRFNNPGEPALAVLSSPAHAVELLKRCQGGLHLAGTGAFDAPAFVDAGRDWSWGPLESLNLACPGPSYSSILWAEPEANSAEQVADQLAQRACNGAGLWVVASGPLRNFLPAWQSEQAPAVQPLNPGLVMRLLQKTGWQIQELAVFHGPRSIAWSFIGRAAERLGKPDWGDRCILAMRRHYREPGWLWPLAPLALIHALAI
jgi:hypothetical protein